MSIFWEAHSLITKFFSKSQQDFFLDNQHDKIFFKLLEQ